MRGKVAIVTGGTGGIGSAVTRRLHDEGARVVAVDLDAAHAERQAATLGGEAIGVGADVSTEAGVQGYMDAALARFGRVDLVHLNAG